MRLETIAVHTAAERDPATGAVAPPIHLSTTFDHGPAGEKPWGYLYVRESNPTQDRLEKALAAVEGGAAAVAYASGVAAGAALLQAMPHGCHVVMGDDIYHAFRHIAREFLPRWQMESTAVDMADLDAVRAAMRPNTKLVWSETPSNPLMKVADIRALVSIAHEGGAKILVDNTFATPVLQRPLDLGADVVLHSTTKYFGGHSDAQGGVLIFRNAPELVELVLHNRYLLGPVASPFNSWLILRGIRSLACRVERQADNAMAVAKALEKHPMIDRVFYPGLPSDPGHEIASKQMTKFGGMLSFLVAGGRDRAVGVASKLQLFVNATSLGGTESLIEHRASSEGPTSTTPQNLLRASVGLEHPDDLIEDLLQALG